MANSEDTAKAMDVQKPGTTTPSSSSRPIINTNHTVMKDPMVKTEETSESSSAATITKSPVASKKVIQPLSAKGETEKTESTQAPEVEQSEQTVVTKTETEVKPKTEQEADKPNPEPQTQENTSSNTQESAKTSKAAPAPPSTSEVEEETAVVDAVVGSATRNKDKQQQDPNADEKRKQAAQVLADSKKYNVTIGQVSKARHNRHTIYFLVIIVLFIVAYVLVDMGMVNVPFELPFEIFNNNL
jgi:hypothetical protein